jgi:hypothetical protein
MGESAWVGPAMGGEMTKFTENQIVATEDVETDI